MCCLWRLWWRGAQWEEEEPFKQKLHTNNISANSSSRRSSDLTFVHLLLLPSAADLFYRNGRSVQHSTLPLLSFVLFLSHLPQFCVLIHNSEEVLAGTKSWRFSGPADDDFSSIIVVTRILNSSPMPLFSLFSSSVARRRVLLLFWCLVPLRGRSFTLLNARL